MSKTIYFGSEYIDIREILMLEIEVLGEDLALQ